MISTQAQPARKRWTIAEIKSRHNSMTRGHLFDRDTMRWFKNTMRDFKVRHFRNNVYVVNTCGGAVYRFDPDTGNLMPVNGVELCVITPLELQEYTRIRDRRMGW